MGEQPFVLQWNSATSAQVGHFRTTLFAMRVNSFNGWKSILLNHLCLMDNLVDSLEIFLSFRALVYDLSLLDEWCGSLGKGHDILGSMLAAFILINLGT